jgi:DNA repair exonuclease SbcCD ATPase subunit
MAQMRVKDQDLVVEQVVSKIEANELEKLKARKDVQTILADADARIEVISRLVEQYQELERNIKAEKNELETIVKSFQEVNEFEDSYSTNQGIKLTDGYSCNTIPSCKTVWDMGWKTKGEISTKLRLQTMGGDFDVYKLIEELTAEFSS